MDFVKKIFGSGNRVNNAKTTMKALQCFKLPKGYQPAKIKVADKSVEKPLNKKKNVKSELKKTQHTDRTTKKTDKDTKNVNKTVNNSSESKI
jgi:hypothetical protein